MREAEPHRRRECGKLSPAGPPNAGSTRCSNPLLPRWCAASVWCSGGLGCSTPPPARQVWPGILGPAIRWAFPADAWCGSVPQRVSATSPAAVEESAARPHEGRTAVHYQPIPSIGEMTLIRGRAGPARAKKLAPRSVADNRARSFRTANSRNDPVHGKPPGRRKGEGPGGVMPGILHIPLDRLSSGKPESAVTGEDRGGTPQDPENEAPGPEAEWTRGSWVWEGESPRRRSGRSGIASKQPVEPFPLERNGRHHLIEFGGTVPPRPDGKHLLPHPMNFPNR